MLYESTAIISGFGIDLALLEIQQPIPPHFNVYYAGWKPDALLGPGGILNAPMRNIHHPAGDVKKVSQISQINKTETGIALNCRLITKAIDAFIRLFGGKSITETVCSYVDVPQYLAPLFDVGATRKGSSGSPFFTSAGRVFGSLSSNPADACANIGTTVGKFRNAYANRNMREALNPDYANNANLFGIGGRDIGCYSDNPLRLSGNYFPANAYQPGNLIVIQAQNNIEAGAIDSDNSGGALTRYARVGANGGIVVNPTGNGIEEEFLRIYNGADFEFRAGGVIRLLDGFVVEQGARFTARIQACNGAREGVDESAITQPGPVAPSLTTATDEPADLVVSPNPSTGAVRCQYLVRQPGAVRLVVIDTQGREVLPGLSLSNQQPGRYNVVQDLSALPPGLYLMQLETATGRTTERVILQR